MRLLLRAGLAEAAGGTPCPMGFWNGLLLGCVATGGRVPAVEPCVRTEVFFCCVPWAKAGAARDKISGKIANSFGFIGISLVSAVNRPHRARHRRHI